MSSPMATIQTSLDELKHALDHAAKEPVIHPKSQLIKIFTPWVIGSPLSGLQTTGSTIALEFNRKSLWTDPNVFSPEEVIKIKNDLILRAKARFKLPESVLMEVMSAVMLSDQITYDGTGLLPQGIVCIPVIYIQYEEQTYYFNKGITKQAFDFFQHEIYQIEARKSTEISKKKYEEAQQRFANETYHQVCKDPHFLTAFNQAKTRVLNASEGMAEYWNLNCKFILGTSYEEGQKVVEGVKTGRHKFL